MSFAPSLVAVRKITSSISRSHFDPGAIDEAANLILSLGALVDPLIVRRIDLESFELLDGHFAYYAAVRARELDPLKGETVLAFIADETSQEAIARQAELLRSVGQKETKCGTSVPRSQEPSELVNRFSHFERRLEQMMNGLEQKVLQEHQNLGRRLNGLEELLPKPIEALGTFNEADRITLFERLKKSGMTEKRAKTLCQRIEEARKNSPFSSLRDVVQRIDGLGADGLLKLLEAWDGMAFYPIPRERSKELASLAN